MICPYCAASISDSEEKCPYCDSYIDHNDGQTDIMKISPRRDDFVYYEENYDQLRLPLVFVSLIPFVGIILGVLCLRGGAPKCGKIYLGIAIASMFVLPVVKALIVMNV